MKKAVLYGNEALIDTRLSPISLKQQITTLKLFCYKHEIEILKIYTDETEDGILQRPSLQKLVKDIESKKMKPDYLLVKYWRYISPVPKEVVEIIDRLHFKKVDVKAIYDFEEAKYESIIYKHKTPDHVEADELRAKGITCVPAIKPQDKSF